MSAPHFTTDMDQFVSNIFAHYEFKTRMKALLELGLTPSRPRSYRGTGRLLDSDESIAPPPPMPTSGMTSQRPKYKPEYLPGRLVLVTDYGERSHALFGDFDSSLVQKLVADMRTCTQWLSENPSLSFGKGFIIRGKQNLGLMHALLKKHDVTYREVSCAKFKMECEGQLVGDLPTEPQDPSRGGHHPLHSSKDPTSEESGGVANTPPASPVASQSLSKEEKPSKLDSSSEDESSSEEDEKSSESTHESHESRHDQPLPSSTKMIQQPTVILNKWNNLWDVESKLIFEKRGPQHLLTCIGKQDRKCTKRGAIGILKLTQADVQYCKEHQWLYDTMCVGHE